MEETIIVAIVHFLIPLVIEIQLAVVARRNPRRQTRHKFHDTLRHGSAWLEATGLRGLPVQASSINTDISKGIEFACDRH